MASEQTSVRVPEDLADWLRERAAAYMTLDGIGKSLVSAAGTLRDLEAVELRRLAFTLPEACLLAEASGGPMLQVGVGTVLWMEVADMTRGLEDHYGAHHGFDDSTEVGALLAKLSALGPTADLALRAALSRWWDNDLPATVEGFGEVGIRVLE